MRCQNTSVPRVGIVQPYSVEATRRPRRRPCTQHHGLPTRNLLICSRPIHLTTSHYYRECKWPWDSDIHSHKLNAPQIEDEGDIFGPAGPWSLRLPVTREIAGRVRSSVSLLCEGAAAVFSQ